MELKHGATVIFVVSLLAALLHPAAACIAEERKALLTFKAGIKEDPQGMLSRWVANGDCCGWGGTFCDNSGHVTQLDLAPDSAFDDASIFLKGMELESRTLAHLIWSYTAIAILHTLIVASLHMANCCRHDFARVSKAHAPYEIEPRKYEAALRITPGNSW